MSEGVETMLGRPVVRGDVECPGATIRFTRAHFTSWANLCIDGSGYGGDYVIDAAGRPVKRETWRRGPARRPRLPRQRRSRARIARTRKP